MRTHILRISAWAKRAVLVGPRVVSCFVTRSLSRSLSGCAALKLCRSVALLCAWAVVGWCPAAGLAPAAALAPAASDARGGAAGLPAQEAGAAQETGAASGASDLNVTIDFGSRTSTRYPLPAAMLGVNHADWWPTQADEEKVAGAGFKVSRTYAQIPQVYATAVPNWSVIDPVIARLESSGFKVLLQLSFTPAWLQPSPNTCGSDKTKAPPSDVNAWAQIAQSYVAHMDAKFPGVVTDYEIWNEPNTGGMCGTSNNLASYLALYAAAGKAIHEQASADGVRIRVGGPASSYMSRMWIEALLTNASTAPYVDFVSYHQYMAGVLNKNATWDTENGTTPLYALTQSSSTGAAAIYAEAVKTVAAGKQPNAASTPVYIDEFNTNWAFAQDCCRNDPTYAPVWNVLYVTDVLNTVYAGAARVPGQLTYYAAVSLPYFCVLGNWDAAMDCGHGAGTPAPYPQYFAYELMASGNYLDMSAGGYLAPSISPAPQARGVALSAFTTAQQDSILIANPTSSTYAETISLVNAGFAAPVAKLFQVVGGSTIEESALPLTKTASGWSARVMIAPLSVYGIVVE